MALNMYDLTFFAKIIQSYSDFNPLELYLFVYTFASCDKEKTKIFVNSLSIKWIQTVTNKEKINHDDKRSKNMLEIIDKLKEILKFFVEIP
jgi:predicted DNA-binding ArsR family transcriptional regulator